MGDPSAIPRSGRSPGEQISHPLQYSWASWWLSQWRIWLQWGRPGFNPWVGKIPWRKAWQPLQYSCLENPCGYRSLAGYSPWDHKESDTTEHSTQPLKYSNFCHFHYGVSWWGAIWVHLVWNHSMFPVSRYLFSSSGLGSFQESFHQKHLLPSFYLFSGSVQLFFLTAELFLWPL